jgi:hypothetical protein
MRKFIRYQLGKQGEAGGLSEIIKESERSGGERTRHVEREPSGRMEYPCAILLQWLKPEGLSALPQV